MNNLSDPHTAVSIKVLMLSLDIGVIRGAEIGHSQAQPSFNTKVEGRSCLHHVPVKF